MTVHSSFSSSTTTTLIVCSRQTLGTNIARALMSTPTSSSDPTNPSESKEAALHGQKALTPILSGAISGGIVGVAWIVGILVWLYKRRRRARRAKAAGFHSYREFLDPPSPHADAFIIPPDPAVLAGQALPGEKILVPDDKPRWAARIRHARTVPIADADADADADVEEGRARGEKERVPPGMDHRASAPCRVPEGSASTTAESTDGEGPREGEGCCRDPAR